MTRPLKLFSPLERRAHPILAIVGTTLMLSMTAIIVAEGLSSPRASPAVPAVVVACILIGAVCSLFGCVPKPSGGEARS